jgi:hypothetical protein
MVKLSTHKVTELGLGSAHVVTLAEARDKAHEYRRAVKQGQGDPIEQKRERRRAQITFAELAGTRLANHQLVTRNVRERLCNCLYANRLMSASGMAPLLF